MKRILSLLTLCILVAGCSSNKEPQVKYVFYFIGDGMGVNQVVGTNFYNAANGLEKVNFSQFPVVNFITTVSANSLVTDSSAAGSALASGVKINNSAVGVAPDGNPVSNLTEWAHAAGFVTGVATSVGVNHATPASFVAHTDKRSSYEEIATQMIDSPVEFMAGATFLTDRDSGHDAAYFENLAQEAGIAVYKGPAAISNLDLSADRVVCLSAKEEDSIPYAIDRKDDDTQLADFTDAAIRYLEARGGKKGFFVMIEGGKVDYAGHGNDAATCFQEVNDMAKSVDLALTFLQRHPNETLILVTADHETGGLALGNSDYTLHLDLLQNQKCSSWVLSDRFTKLFKETSKPRWEDVKRLYRENLGFWDTVEISCDEEKELKALYKAACAGKGKDAKNMYKTINSLGEAGVALLNKKAHVGWTTRAHSAHAVPIFAIGPNAELFSGWHDNSDIVPLLKKALGN